MVDVIQRLILESEVGNTKTELEQVRKEQAKLEAAIRDSAKTTDKASDEYKEQVKALKGLVDRERELEKQIQNTNDAYGDRRKVIEKTDDFDRISQDVSLAGDAESNLRTIGGAVGAFGGTGVERGIGQASELFAVVEAAPRLKAAFAGMPATINAAAQALGTSSGGLIGAIALAAVVTAAFQFALKEYNKGIQENKTAIQAATDIIRNYNEFIAGGGTSQAAQERIAELQRLRDAEVATAESIKRAQQGFAESATIPAFARFRDDFKEFDTQLTASQGTVGEYDLEIRKLQEAMDNGVLAANDAIAAEQALAAERTQGILTDAAQAGELEASKLRLADATREQINAELDGLAIRKASLEAELAILQASGDTSEAVQKKIAQLTETLSFLGEQSEQLEGLRSKAKTDKQVESEKKLAAARDETAKASDKATASERGAVGGGSSFAQRRADSARNRSASTIGFGFLTGQSGAEQKADTNEIDKQLRETQNSIIEVNNDYEEQRVQQAIDSNRRLQDIARDFGDQRADAFEDGNFLALDRLNTEEARANRDAAIDTRRANDDRLREQQNALRNLQQQEQQFHQQRLQLNQQGFQAALSQQQQFISAFIGNFSNMFGALSGARSGVRRPATP